MKLKIVKIGRAASPEIEPLVQKYVKRLHAFWDVECLQWKEADGKAGGRWKTLKTPSSVFVVLDERGKEFSSVEFATQLKKWRDDPATKQINFLIGGPYGLEKELLAEAGFKLALSKATLPSDLAWITLSEALYRASTILSGGAYHHE